MNPSLGDELVQKNNKKIGSVAKIILLPF